MQKRWASGFTVVELVIVIIVTAILVTVGIVGYNGISKAATVRSAQSDLDNVAVAMHQAFQKTGTYPATLPDEVRASSRITLTVSSVGSTPFYTGLSEVQNGTLLAQICSDLIAEGVGQGLNQAGAVQNYITGCGNWNHDSMQVTGWNTRVWNTPVTEAALTTYADNFTTSDTWNQSQETVVKNFYGQMVSRLKAQGGSFPVDTFWDYWANSGNGGVLPEPLDSNPQLRSFYCVEATSAQFSDVTWHITEDSKIRTGGC